MTKSSGKREIFIVEGDMSIRHDMALALLEVGYEPLFLSSSEELMVLSQRRLPACILLDIHKSALNTLAKLDSQSYPAPAVVIFRNGTLDLALRAIRAGAVDFVEAPFEPKDLLDCVEASIRRFTNRSRASLAKSMSLAGGVPMSCREQAVFRQVLLGSKNKDMARLLNISVRTVESRRSAILKKLAAEPSSDLALLILQRLFRQTDLLC